VDFFELHERCSARVGAAEASQSISQTVESFRIARLQLQAAPERPGSFFPSGQAEQTFASEVVRLGGRRLREQYIHGAEDVGRAIELESGSRAVNFRVVVARVAPECLIEELKRLGAVSAVEVEHA
jgi:hypothetical protein